MKVTLKQTFELGLKEGVGVFQVEKGRYEVHPRQKK